MSTKLRKKTRRKKKKNIIEDDIRPQQHPRVGDLNYFSEEITKDITEKLISLVFTSIFRKKIERKINDVCFDSTKNMISNIIEISNVNHDIDDFDIDKIDINEYVEYNNTDTNIRRYKIKNHNKIKELKNDIAKENLLNSMDISKNIDSYTNISNKKVNDYLNKSTLVENNKYISLGKLYQFSIDIVKNNFWGNIPCPQVSDIDRTAYNFNNLVHKKDKPIKKVKFTRKAEAVDKKKSFLKKNTFSYRNFVSKFTKKFDIFKDNNKQNFFASLTPRGKSAKMIDMPSYPLENFETRKEIEGISDLRKEVIELQIKKEKALKKKIVIIKERKKEEDIKKEKMIKKGKFTLDNAGNIVIVNEINQDKLTKEFLSLSSKQKEIKAPKTLEVINNEKNKLQIKAAKNIEYNKVEQVNTNPYLIKAQLLNPLININNITDMMNSYYNDATGNTTSKINKKSEDLFYLLNNINKTKVEVSGSNFKLINPSVGVRITEKNQEKSGGNDYYHKYHKFSLNDFNRTLQNNFGLENIIFDKKQNELFNPNITTDLPNLNKNILLKNMRNEENETEKEQDQNKTEINFSKVKHVFNQKIKNRMIRNKNLGNKINPSKFSSNKNSSSTNLTNIKQTARKTMYKSSSELFLENEKFFKLKEALFSHNNKDIIFTKINPYANKQTDIYNLCDYKNKTLIKQNSIKNLHIKNNIYKDIDNFNKNIIMGRTAQSKATNGKMILPKISFKNNEINFNKSMLNFTRNRTKKGIWEEYIQKKENDSKRKKVKKINFVKK